MASVRLDELGWTGLSESLEEMKIRARDRAFNFPCAAVPRRSIQQAL
jgi:hypothetical protein